MKHFRIAVIVLCGLAVASCAGGAARFQSGLEKTNAWVTKYGPIIGKDIIMVANILVQAECSPALGSATATVTNVLKIVAPTSSKAQTVGNVLATNYQVAQELCPLISAIKTSVGSVPNVAPSQVVPASP